MQPYFAVPDPSSNLAIQKTAVSLGSESAAKSQEHELTPISKDAFVWWQLTSGFLLELVSHAGFTPQQQRSSMEFYYNYVVPNLGPSPTETGLTSQWRSFMTDDFTPIEFSWYWGNADAIPDRRVRFSIEPIGNDAGSAKDPWNTSATRALAHQLSETFRGLELQWFDQLLDSMMANHSGYSLVRPSDHQASPASAFLAFELGDSEPLVKAYLLPPGGNRMSQTSKASLLCDTLGAFAEEKSWKSLIDLIGFLQKEGKTMQLHPLWVAVDCIVQQPRVKIYVRSPDTSFTSAKKIMSMFDDLDQISSGLEELQDLWKRVFCLEDDFDPHRPLHPAEHETAGILYYLEVRPNSQKVTSKVYLPVKHYGRDDWSTALGLTDFFKSRTRVQAKIVDQYLASLRAACTHRRLDSDRGMQTYITATIRNGSLDITSYLNPEVYHKNRYGGRR